MFTRIAPSVLVVCWLTASAGADAPVTFPQGIVSKQLGLVFVTTGGAAASRVIANDPRGGYYAAFATDGAIVALRLDTGKQLWKTDGVLVPLYLHGGKLVAYAKKTDEVVFAVLDAKKGKVLARISTEWRVPQERASPGPGCQLDAPASQIVTLSSRGEGPLFRYTSEVTSCPARKRHGGAHMGDDELQAAANECVSSRQELRLDLDSLELKVMPPSKPGSATSTAPAPTPPPAPPPAPRSMPTTEPTYVGEADMKALKTRLGTKLADKLVAAEVSVDGQNTFAYLKGDKPDQSQLMVLDNRTKKGTGPVLTDGTQDTFRAYLSANSVVIGTDSAGLAARRMRGGAQVWQAKTQVAGSIGPRCPQPP